MLERFQSKRAQRERKAEDEYLAFLKESVADFDKRDEFAESIGRKNSYSKHEMGIRQDLRELKKKRERRQTWSVIKVAILIFILFQIAISCSS